MHRVAFSVDDIDEALEIAARHGCHPLRGVATYGDVHRLTYVRGPSGIIHEGRRHSMMGLTNTAGARGVLGQLPPLMRERQAESGG
jgi:hypothetical protein